MRRFLVAALLIGGCAWGPGGGFATVTPEPIDVTLELPPSRLDAQGRWKTDNGYAVSVSRLTITLSDSRLEGAGSSVSPATFDPARPPAGYSLCHNGHCHRADGALVDYAAIEAELARGTAAPSETLMQFNTGMGLTIPVPGRATTSRPFGCTPDCLLDLGNVERATLQLAALSAEGTVVAGSGMPALGPEPRPFNVTLDLGPMLLAAPVSVNVRREGPAHYTYAATLAVTEKLFDNLNWADYPASGAIDLHVVPTARETLIANMAKSQWQPRLTP